MVKVKTAVAIFVAFFFAIFSPLAFATSNDGDFTILIDEWFFSVQWDLNTDLEYLDAIETYYDVLLLVSDNYDDLKSKKDSVQIYIAGNNDIAFYHNDEVLFSSKFFTKEEFAKLLYERLSELYKIARVSNCFEYFKVAVPESEGDCLGDFSQIAINSSAPRESSNGKYEYYFLNEAYAKCVAKKYAKSFGISTVRWEKDVVAIKGKGNPARSESHVKNSNYENRVSFVFDILGFSKQCLFGDRHSVGGVYRN